MRLSEDIDFTTLTWVKGELDETLKQARQALEAYVEDPSDASQMRFCATYLHQVQGTLRMVELYGAAMVTEEMEHLATALLDGEVKDREDAYTVLMRGIVQLPDYLERLQSGHRDIPIVLLPLLNDLRSARGEKGLSESVLFTPDLSRALPPQAHGPGEPLAEATLRSQAEQLRGQFQLALLKWFRSEDVDANVARLTQVCDQLVGITTQEDARRLFWVAAGVLEALRAKAFEANPQLKQTIGKVEREIKRLADGGEAAFRVDPPRELTRNLLYFVAHAPTEHGRIGELRSVFRLEGMMPSESEVAHARGAMSGHNRALLDTVSAAIKEDLLRVKDALDLYMRSADARPADLQPQGEILDRVADTLGMLGLGVARRVVQEQRQSIDEVVSGARPADEGALLDIAGALLYVEASLDDQVQHLGAAAVQARSDSPLPPVEARRVLDSVVREAQANFAQAKQCFVAFIESNWDHSQLEDVPRLLEEVAGALRIMELTDAPQYLLGVRRFTELELLARHRVPNGQQMDTLADALTSLEYFLDALREHRPGRERILDTARRSLEALGYWPVPEIETATPAPPPAEVVTPSPESPIEAAGDARSEPTPQEHVDESPAEPAPPAPAPHVPTPRPLAAEAGGFAASEEIDEEIREVFIEEVQEEIAHLESLLPTWKSQPDDLERLKPIRRVFHTLKGSGRLVGALTLGEFSWKVENMLNRVLDQTVAPSPAVQALVDHAYNALPELLAGLRGERVPRVDLAGLEAVADRLAAGEEAWYAPVSFEPEAEPEPEQETAAGTEQAPPSAPQHAAAALDARERLVEVAPIDPVLFEILKSEVAGHLDTVDAWLAGYDAAPQPVSDPLLRAVHTMNGAFAMTEVPSVTDFISPLEGMIKRMLARGEVPTREDAALVREAVAGVRESMVALEAERPLLPDYDDLAQRIARARDALPEPMGPSLPLHLDDDAHVDVGAPTAIDLDLPDDRLVADVGATPVEATANDDAMDGFDVASLDAGAPTDATAGDAEPPVPEGEEAADDGERFDFDFALDLEGYEAGELEAVDLSALDVGDATQARDTDVLSLDDLVEEAELADVPTGFELREGPLTPAASSDDQDAMPATTVEDAARADDEAPAVYALDDAGLDDGATAAEADLPMADDALSPGGRELSDDIADALRGEAPADAPLDGEEPSLEQLADDALDEAAAAPTDGLDVEALALDSVALGDAAPDAGDAEAAAHEAGFADEDLAGEAPAPVPTDDEALAAATPDEGEIALPDTGDASLEEAAAALRGFAAEEATEAPAEEAAEEAAEEVFEDVAEASFDEPSTGEASVAEATFESAGEPVAEATADEAPHDDAQETPAFADGGRSDLDDYISTSLGEVHAEGQAQAEAAQPSPVRDAEPAATDAYAQADPDPDLPLDLADLDEELLDIFLEEGTDILDHSDGLLAKLRETPHDRELVVGLQRDLHTLKGGARMAGMAPIGDLGHAMESLLESVADGRTELHRDGVETLERCFDRLHGMVTRVAERRAIAMPATLIARVEALGRGETVATEVVAATAQAGAAAESAPARRKPELPPISEPVFDEDEDIGAARAPQEQIRIRADLLDRLVNYAGEVAIYRARLEQQLGTFRGSLSELDQTTTRLREQLRRLEIETEAQIIARYQREGEVEEGFDPLELDRFSNLQQLSRALAESAADLVNLQTTLDDQTRQYETLLLQQSRVSSDLQEGLMRTRMVPFDALVPRLRRILRQTCSELGRKAQLRVDGAQGEMDRSVLDRMTAPLEHMLRNAIAHGMESPEERRRAGKPEEGTVRIAVSREASEVVIRVEDDGRGIDRDAIRAKAIERGLMKPDAQLSDRDLYGFILETGFSTAATVSKIAGRGVGMDVVNAEIKQLGGALLIDSERGRGTQFTIRLPFTLAVTQAVFVKLGETSFAVPIASVQGVARIDRAELDAQLRGDSPTFEYAGEDYGIYDLGLLLGHGAVRAEDSLQVPLLLARSGDLRAAICVDQVVGSREIVVKPTGPQVSSIPGIFGATIMGDGRVVVILDVAPLVRRAAALQQQGAEAQTPRDAAEEVRRVPLVMVVDDSITMRKVTGRVLERHNYEVMTAKDGVDAIEKLSERIPDVMLLDIEMPRMDGYELATHIRNDVRLRDIPIIMITSRTGEKHRQRAFEIGVDRYLGKPYQEAELMRNVQEIVRDGRGRRG